MNSSTASSRNSYKSGNGPDRGSGSWSPSWERARVIAPMNCAISSSAMVTPSRSLSRTRTRDGRSCSRPGIRMVRFPLSSCVMVRRSPIPPEKRLWSAFLAHTTLSRAARMISRSSARDPLDCLRRSTARQKGCARSSWNEKRLVGKPAPVRSSATIWDFRKGSVGRTSPIGHLTRPGCSALKPASCVRRPICEWKGLTAS